MTDLLTDKEISDVGQPAVTAYSLPPRCFTSQDFFEEEQVRIFKRDWIGIGRADRLKQAGDYFTFAIGREPFIATCDGDGAVRVFANSCLHRGSLIVEGKGHTKSFVCPYHGWTFNPAGEMIGSPFMNRTENFDKKSCRLGEVAVELWEGFVFVNFNHDASPIAERLAGLSERIANYRFADMRTDETIELVNDCNWKIGVENAVDEYHAFIVHESLTPTKFYHLHDTFAVADPDGAWVMNCTPAIRPHPFTTGTASQETPFPAVPGLSSFEMQSFNVLSIFPNMIIALNADNLITLIFFPLAPDKTLLHIAMNYPAATFEMPEFERHAREATQALIDTNEQDMYGCRLAQQGLYSSLLTPGRLSYLEEAVTHFDRYIAQRMRMDDQPDHAIPAAATA